MSSFITTFLVAGFLCGASAQAEDQPLNPVQIMEKAAAGGDKKPKKPKSQYNSNLYEQEEAKDDTKSFTGKVRVVRDISDDIEVLFEGEDAKGIYSLSRSKSNFAAMLKSLEASKKAGGPAVTVTADSDKNIKSVELNKAGSSRSGYVPPTDPNQKWDFGKVPD
ncbi:hypothetical protein [Bdellovibrio svalbardensis]|uniref:Uncharacterized protein n=1 Tax=Bdellovibrio svalbardensis TaxID=2972972 RepID=A0ABT6DGP5_9BACT|nr:hypothetical protein [Bdellovibrio svalbardensis]MDG0816029.1 hypothetical protein [Bdellovibrio svalbardensis]